jgi:hypothetical protein
VTRASIATAVLLWGLALARPCAAQSLGLTPAEIRATFKPQQVLQFDLNLSNDSDTPVAMRGSVMDLWYDPTTNLKTFGTPGTLPHSAANWVTFVPPTFSVPAHGSGKVKVMVTPPAGATGGSYAVLFVESKPALVEATAEGKPIYTNLRLGALMLLSAAGSEDYRVAITDTRLTPPTASRNLELAFDLANLSNVHVFPESHLTIVNARKQVVARADGEIRRFFPGQKDSLKLTWAGELPAGDYAAVLTVSYGDNKVYTQTLPLQIGGAAIVAGGP